LQQKTRALVLVLVFALLWFFLDFQITHLAREN
jgi:hypothetical protein